MQLDTLLGEFPGVQRLPGAHCYEVFAGSASFAMLHDQELGTFYLTDFLARHFDTKQIIELCATVGLSNQVNRFHATFLTDLDTTIADALSDSCPVPLPPHPS